MFKNMKIGTKIVLAFSLITIVAVGIGAIVGITMTRRALEEESFNKLTAVREMKASQIEDYFQLIAGQVDTLSKDRMIIEAMHAFDESLDSLPDELNITDEEIERIDGDLERYYRDEFIPRLEQNVEEEVDIDDFWPEDDKSRIVQSLYLSGNPNDVGSKQLLDSALDGSKYSQAHEIYHPILREFLEQFGYYDVFLVSADEGHIAYSVFKEADFGTSLLSGPYADSAIGEVYQEALGAEAEQFTVLVDYDPYAPSYNAPAAFIASPIFDGEEKSGVLIFQMPIDRIDAIMTNNQAWNEIGLGESGETYLVGDDFTLRNQSRFLIEDSDNYFKLIEEIGVPSETIDSIRNLDTTIGLQEVRTPGTEAALAGETGTSIFPDYRGVPVLSAYKPLDIEGLDWAIMSEIDEAEAFSAANSIRDNLLLVFGVLVGFSVIGALLFSRTITQPLKKLTENAEELAHGNLDLQITMDRGDEIGLLAKSFDTMRESIKGLVRRQEEAIDALSIPLIPLTDEVVVMPLVGELDERRLDNIRQSLSDGLHAAGATVAILDITGVPKLEQQGATGLIRAARTASLLGAQVIITGVRPEIAQYLAELDIQFDGLVTKRSLQQGVNFATGQSKMNGGG